MQSPNGLSNFLPAVPVAEGIWTRRGATEPLGIGFGWREYGGQPLWVAAGQTGHPAFHRFWPLGRLPQHNQWAPQCRRLLLDPAGIGDNEPGACEQVNEGSVGQR